MSELNTKDPVFLVGAPKAGSTSIHMALAQTGLFDYPALKNSHYLISQDFSLEEYSKYFSSNGKRIFEIDQNLSIHRQAFINIGKFFQAPIIVYVTRDPEQRFISAYKWLKKMGLVKSVEEAVDKYWNWMVEHGKYRRNITSNMLPYLKADEKLLVVRFEELVSDDGVTFSELKRKLGIAADSVTGLEFHNESVKARFPAGVKYLRILVNNTKHFLPHDLIASIRDSAVFKRLLFRRERIHISDAERGSYEEFSSLFAEEQSYIDSLDFVSGIAEVK